MYQEHLNVALSNSPHDTIAHTCERSPRRQKTTDRRRRMTAIGPQSSTLRQRLSCFAASSSCREISYRWYAKNHKKAALSATINYSCTSTGQTSPVVGCIRLLTLRPRVATYMPYTAAQVYICCFRREHRMKVRTPWDRDMQRNDLPTMG